MLSNVIILKFFLTYFRYFLVALANADGVSAGLISSLHGKILYLMASSCAL